MRVRETVEVGRPADDVYATLAEPECRSGEGPWRDLERDDGAYSAKLHVPGLVDIDFDCRFELEVDEGDRRVRVRGMGTSPRLGFTFEGSLSVRGDAGTSTVETDVEVLPGGALAGLGQRRIREQARRLIAEFIVPSA